MYSLLILGAAFSIATAGSDGKCRGLALAGGGDKGAYQAGVIAGLVTALPPGEAEYDVVTGVGTGALNALGFALFPKGRESQAALTLTVFWEQSGYSDFYEDWDGGILEGLFFQSGLYDSAPLTALVEKLSSNGTFGRTLIVGATDLVSGQYITFNNSLGLSDLQAGVIGSFSIPGTFPTVPLDDLVLTDGSIKVAADAFSAVTYCHSQGYNNSDIIIDTALVSGDSLQAVDASGYKTLQVYIRSREIESYDDVMRVVDLVGDSYPGVTLRTVTYPSQALPGQADPWPYDFSSGDLRSMIELGFTDAVLAVASASGLK